MSVPTTLFIDTSIFDAFQYNFNSAIVKEFLDTIAKDEYILLLPDPIEMEIFRHIGERSDRAANSLKGAAKSEPFLYKWDGFPNLEDPWHIKLKIRSSALQEFDEFLGKFCVERLNYDGVDLKQIMKWYDRKVAPFSEGKKNEFPDAITLAIINQYQKSHDDMIAIISQDSDFKRACDRYENLHYYSSFAAYLEINNTQDIRLTNVQAALGTHEDIIWKEITNAFQEAEFSLSHHWDAEIVESEIITHKEVSYRVIAQGDTTCTVAFETDIEFSVEAVYDDYDNATYADGEAITWETIRDTFIDQESLSGIMKLRTSNCGDNIEEVLSVNLDQKTFRIFSSEYCH